MFRAARFALIGFGALLQAGCGMSVPQEPEIWDRGDPGATQHMELQVKHAIFCELREAAQFTRQKIKIGRDYEGRQVTSPEDIALPPSWGAQIELTFTVDEKSAVQPSLSIKTPIHNAPVNFPGETIGATGALAATTYGPLSVPQSYALNLGGLLSSQAIRYDKYDYFYSMKDLIDLATDHSVCERPPVEILGDASHSTPFLIKGNLGIREWLPGAVLMTSYQRSSRASLDGEGRPLGKDTSDSMTYDIKFVVISEGSLNPVWNLVRVGTNASPTLLDANRTRTHELLLTIGPGSAETKPKAGKGRLIGVPASGPSVSAGDAFLASQIGNAVARALRQ